MSERRCPSRHWHCYLNDMIEFCERILYYTSGVSDQQSFVMDGRTFDATLRNLELLGEAARHVPAAVQASAERIAWREIIGMRNRLAHGYLSIDNDVVWQTVHTEVPILLRSLRRLSQTLDQENCGEDVLL